MMFNPTKIKNVEIRNRIARSATYEGLGNYKGEPTEKHRELYNMLAEGEVGLLITSAAVVERFKIEFPEKAGFAYPIFIDRDELSELWKPIVADVHAHGAKIAMQIVHPGRQTSPLLLGGEPPIAPSAVKEKFLGAMPREMTTSEIKDMIEKFAHAIRRGKQAGFDAVQLHGGHGYLISSFISPYTNRRTDEYGGDTERRARFIVDIVRRARELVGENYPIMIKMNCDDFVTGGLTMDESVRLARLIESAGIDCIEITAGIWETGDRISMKGISKVEKEAYFYPYAEALRKAVSIPLILVGGMRSPNVIEKVLSDGVADMVSLCRPFIREPQLVKRWKEGDLSKARCISCNKCTENTFRRPLRCYVEELEKEKRAKTKKKE
jgi:2,4-dienoyl-CoA reductase-like NADH-dependent reductase (Old Yellow Enzyme family)